MSSDKNKKFINKIQIKESMLNLEIGDPNNLTGNLVAYSKFTSINEDYFPTFRDGDILSLYFTSDRKNFIEKGHEVGAPDEFIDSILNKADSHLNSRKESIGLELIAYPLHMPPFSERIDLPVDSYDDVIFCGEHSTMNKCIKKNINLAHEYIKELKNQISSINAFSISDLEKNSMHMITYKDINKLERSSHVINNYLIPMDRAIKKGSKGEFNRLKQEFISIFSYGYKPIDDFIKITKLIEKQVSGNSISHYLNKICEIKSEY